MITILQTELIKLRRTMIPWMIAGVIIIPIVFNFIYVMLSDNTGNTTFNWSTAFVFVNFLLTILIAPIFYGSIASYIFSREYREGTVEAHFTYPYRRTSLFIGKMILIFLFIIISCFIIFGTNLIICLLFADVPPPSLFLKNEVFNTINIAVTQCVLICITILASIAFRNMIAGILTAVIGCSTAIAMLFLSLGDWQLLNPYFFSVTLADISNYEPIYIYSGIGVMFAMGAFAFLCALYLYKNNDII